MTKRLHLTFDAGGLCNRIFPLANAIAAGTEYGYQVVNESFHRYRQYFSCHWIAIFQAPFWEPIYLPAADAYFRESAINLQNASALNPL